jgi:hypothetical protein
MIRGDRDRHEQQIDMEILFSERLSTFPNFHFCNPGFAMKTLGESLQRLDQESRLRIRIFTFKLLVVVTMALALAVPRGYPALPLVSLFCLWQGVFAALTAILSRHKVAAGCLTGWDEAAAFVALWLLTRSIGAAV